MSFMNEGVIGIEQAVSVVLGSNIGTCVTTVMAAVSGGYAARQTAGAHVVFNILGVLLVFPSCLHQQVLRSACLMIPRR